MIVFDATFDSRPTRAASCVCKVSFARIIGCAGCPYVPASVFNLLFRAFELAQQLSVRNNLAAIHPRIVFRHLFFLVSPSAGMDLCRRYFVPECGRLRREQSFWSLGCARCCELRL